MAVVNIKFLFRGIVDLEDHALLRANKDALNGSGLKSGRRFFEGEFEIEHCENCVPRLVIENNWSASEILVFDTPESNVLAPAGYELVAVDWRVLQAQHVEITNLLRDDFWLALLRRLPAIVEIGNIPNRNHLTLLFVHAHGCQVLSIVRERHTLRVLVRTRERLHAITACEIPHDYHCLLAILASHNPFAIPRRL